jgi:outer membrane receptor protein involved in Fe transport
MTQFNGDGSRPDGTPDPVFSDSIPWTTRVDASLGYTRPKGDIWFDFFVTNLTNMTYMTSLINVPSTNLRFYNPPRQFGIRATVEM